MVGTTLTNPDTTVVICDRSSCSNVARRSDVAALDRSSTHREPLVEPLLAAVEAVVDSVEAVVEAGESQLHALFEAGQVALGGDAGPAHGRQVLDQRGRCLGAEHFIQPAVELVTGPFIDGHDRLLQDQQQQGSACPPAPEGD